MLERLLRVLVDTNIWISSFINPSGSPARVLTLLTEERYVLVASEPLMTEIENALARPRIRRSIQLPDDDIASILRRSQKSAIVVNPSGNLRLCRDPKDDILLETAILGNADYIVSRDDDMKRDLALIAHLREHGIEVLSVAQFLDLLENGR